MRQRRETAVKSPGPLQCSKTAQSTQPVEANEPSESAESLLTPERIVPDEIGVITARWFETYAL